MKRHLRRSDRSGRAPLFSLGRPPVAGRDERRRFWAAIAAGITREDAAVGVGVPQAVGTRWFRKAGGMPPSMFGLSAKPLSGREEIALLRVQGYSMQEVARRLGAIGIDDCPRAAAQRRHQKRWPRVSRDDSAMACRASCSPPKAGEACAQRGVTNYVEERLAGVVVIPSGAPVSGPVVPWKSRRHGPRKHRRWANAWSPE
jgi:hypothetical protein